MVDTSKSVQKETIFYPLALQILSIHKRFPLNVYIWGAHMLACFGVKGLVGLWVSSHQTGRSASSSPSESHQCGSSFLVPLPFSGKSWSCDYLSAAPTAELDALYFGRRTETCQRTTGPTRYNSAWMASGASQTGTGTNAPSSFLPQRKGIYWEHFTNTNNSLCVCVCVWCLFSALSTQTCC